MPVPRLSPASFRALNSGTSRSPVTHCSQTSNYAVRTLSSTTHRRAADHGAAHEDHYDPPSGWLWGIKPGEKPEKEGWEGIFFWGFGGSLILATVAYAFKPDTSIQTWALEEARRRLEAEGILKEPDSKS